VGMLLILRDASRSASVAKRQFSDWSDSGLWQTCSHAQTIQVPFAVSTPQKTVGSRSQNVNWLRHLAWGANGALVRRVVACDLDLDSWIMRPARLVVLDLDLDRLQANPPRRSPAVIRYTFGSSDFNTSWRGSKRTSDWACPRCRVGYSYRANRSQTLQHGPNGRERVVTDANQTLPDRILGPPWPLFSSGWMAAQSAYLERIFQVVSAGGHPLRCRVTGSDSCGCRKFRSEHVTTSLGRRRAVRQELAEW